MDELLSKAGSQAVTFAIKSGISLASSFAIKTITNFITQVPEARDAKRLQKLRSELEDRIEIVSAAIDLLTLVAARGNTNLESTLKLTKSLKNEIDQFDENLQSLLSKVEGSPKNFKAQSDAIKRVEEYILGVLRRIDEVTPFINLSISTSGASLSSGVSLDSISPGLLLRSSDYVTKNNVSFREAINKRRQDKGGQDTTNFELRVGPIFEVTLFSIYYNLGSEAQIQWKEDMKRAFVEVVRVPDTERGKYNYVMRIKQSFDDERYHNVEDGEEVPKSLEISLDCIEKLFFSVSGRLLKLEDQESAVLVLRVNNNGDKNEDTTVTWYALGQYEATIISDSETESESEENEEEPRTEKYNDEDISKSITLLEYIIRLTSLQNNDQQSILEVKDERLSIYLSDENPNSVKAHRRSVKNITKKLENLELES